MLCSWALFLEFLCHSGNSEGGRFIAREVSIYRARLHPAPPGLLMGELQVLAVWRGTTRVTAIYRGTTQIFG